MVSKESAVQVLGEFGDQCVTLWARDLINNGRVAEAHSTLMRISGINYKIASLFLRDVATTHDLIPPRADRERLQPIDTWLRRVVHKCAGKRYGAMEDGDCASYLVERARDPERANQGIWYFCVRIAGSSDYRVRQCMDDVARLHDMVEWHIQELGNAGRAAAEFVKM